MTFQVILTILDCYPYRNLFSFAVYILCLLSTVSTDCCIPPIVFGLQHVYNTRRPASVPLCHLSFTQCYKSIQMWNSLSLEVREASYSDFVSYILLHIYCICYRVCCCSCYCKYGYALWIVMCVCLYLLQGRTAIVDCLEFKSSIISATDILTQLSVEHKCWAKQF